MNNTKEQQRLKQTIDLKTCNDYITQMNNLEITNPNIESLINKADLFVSIKYNEFYENDRDLIDRKLITNAITIITTKTIAKSNTLDCLIAIRDLIMDKIQKIDKE
jgi:hypothetical protein